MERAVMNSGLPDIMRMFTGLKVLVIGEAMLDVYLEGTGSRLCREAPVPVISVSGKKNLPGGAANAAVNIASLGGRALFLSVIGQDREGELLKRSLEERGVETTHLLEHPKRVTLAKHRLIATSQMLLRFDEGSVHDLDPGTEKTLISRLRGCFPGCDAVLVSDYGYGVMTPAVIRALAELRKRYPRIVVADARRPERYREAGVTAVKPNYGETARMLGLNRLEGLNARADQVAASEEKLFKLTGAHIVAVTLDAEGAILFEKDKPPYRTYAQPAADSRATGAGDTFVSALTLALAAGGSAPCAAELASAAASIVVSKEGTAACSAQELRGFLSKGNKYLPERGSLAALEAFYHRKGWRIIFTNGCFDILHRGHVTYLSNAKALGEALFVGINSDESVGRLKGPGRPINVLEDRIQVLAALSCIDHVVGFEEDTACDIIRILRPDIYVKGGDYRRETLPEAALVESLGGKVHIFPYLEDNSTTGIIERIHRAGKNRARGAAAFSRTMSAGKESV
ncbi:MAG: D-glycero-beta-D-manno-heptose 1-phosphate adenylyltransferase [Endomicrobiales bacterium]